MDLRRISGEGVKLMRLAQDMDQWRAVVKSVLNIQVL